jgi:two-component system chemotaxis response regulator CheB
VGVLLSGVLDDGIAGLSMIRSRGGVTIGQLPEDALFPALPTNALNAGVLDYQVAAADIGKLLTELAQRKIEHHDIAPDLAMELENRIAKTVPIPAEFDAQEIGEPSGYTCPDCNGSLVTLSNNNFRCRIGHAWTGTALLNARDDEVERALGVALRSMQEKAKLARQLAGNIGGMLSEHYTTLAEETEEALSVLKRRLAANAPHGGAGHD